jgi:dTDP-4-amino-4,6-dideoxygalactose transaminase
LIPASDLGAGYVALRDELDPAIQAILAGGEYERGEDLWRLEEELAAACGVAHAVAVGSGLAALFLALRALGVGPGDEVIAPPNTDISTCAAISHTGAEFVWADVDEATHNLDPARVAEAITPRTRAIVAVHLYGLPAPADELRALAEPRGIVLVEDAALAFGARVGDRPAGSLGDVAAFSFAPAKVLGAYGDGGLITTDDGALARRARLLAGYGEPFREAMAGPDGRQRLEAEGYHSHLDLLQAAVLRVKLRHLPAAAARRRALAARYDAGLAGSPAIVPPVPAGVTHAYRNYVVRVPRRDAVRATLAARGIETALLYVPPLHRQPVYRGRAAGPFPIADRLAEELLCLPMYPELADDDADRVALELRRAVEATT